VFARDQDFGRDAAGDHNVAILNLPQAVLDEVLKFDRAAAAHPVRSPAVYT